MCGTAMTSTDIARLSDGELAQKVRTVGRCDNAYWPLAAEAFRRSQVENRNTGMLVSALNCMQDERPAACGATERHFLLTDEDLHDIERGAPVSLGLSGHFGLLVVCVIGIMGLSRILG